MKKVLYVSNIEVPYRSEFFNQLAKKIDLTVLYERKKSSNRDKNWTESVKSNYDIEYLKGIHMKNEYTFDVRILKYVFSKKYDKIIIGCSNSPSQMLAIFFMKLFHKKYILNLDGEYFLDGKGINKKIKKFFIKGADEYLIAGEKSGENLAKYVPKEKVHPYYFSSLTKKELEENAKHVNKNINNKVLVVGQYFDYKGLDIALEVAKLDQSIKYRFVGSGKRSKMLEKKVKAMGLKNVEIISFMKKELLYKEYQECRCLLLPSRQECWGLVVNEAASFCCPIISSKKCGAAIEFFDGKFCKLLFDLDEDNMYENILIKIKESPIDIDEYRRKIKKIIKKYSVEESVNCYLNALGENEYEDKN